MVRMAYIPTLINGEDFLCKWVGRDERSPLMTTSEEALKTRITSFTQARNRTD